MEKKDNALTNTLTQTMDKISEALDQREIYRIVENLLNDLTQSEFTTFLIFDTKKQTLYTPKEKRVSISMVNPEGLLGKSFLTKEPAIYNHIASEKLYVPAIDNQENIRLRSQLIVPILKDDNLIAIVKVSRSIYITKHYTLKEIDIINALGDFFGEVIQKLLINEDANYSMVVDHIDINQKIEKIKSNNSKNDEINSTMLFLANTVHDIRTPANALHGFLEVLEEQVEDIRLKEFIENAKESALFINTLTDSILRQVKDTHEIKTSRPEVVNSIKFFSQIGNLFSANMCKKEIYYLIYICPNVPKEILIDKVKVKRIIINLIGNAYKFTPSNKRIYFEVKCNTEKKHLIISIRDTGLGIDKSRQKVIFNSFEQAKEDTNEHFGGTGLGLAISSKYVDDLGGKLSLESELDKGSNFYFNLPLNVVTSEPSQEQFTNFGQKILILTDNIECIDAANIRLYLIKLGMNKKDITISDKVKNDTTHMFCFQHKLSKTIIKLVEEKKIKLVIVEETLFSLSKNETYKNIDIISENTYYGDKVHSAVFSGKKIKILIADDSKINLILLKTMLETEYCTIDTVINGTQALNSLKYAYTEDNHLYDIIFLDEHMPDISGCDVLNRFREFEKEKNIAPIFAISVTGDPSMSEENRNIYDLQMNKPFNKQDIREAVRVAKEAYANRISLTSS